jgi:hypothetical protein
MRDLEILIREYCEQNLPTEPIWITILNRRFPRIAAHMDIAKSMQCEIADHLRDAHEANLAKGHNAEDAWRLAREQFGNIDLISKEIYKARALSYKCLTIRLMAVVILFILSFTRPEIRFHAFFHPESLSIMALCATVCALITRKRNMASIRKYAMYGAGLGLFYGIIRAITTVHQPPEIGAAIAMILMSAFYGLFLAAPSARGWIFAAMVIACQLGISVVCVVFAGPAPLYPSRIDPALLSLGFGATLFALLVGLTVFDIRRLQQRISAIAVSGMVTAWVFILSNLRRPDGALELVFATSVPVLLTFMIASPIRILQAYLLREAD